jgi:hypothetical protein
VKNLPYSRLTNKGGDDQRISKEGWQEYIEGATEKGFPRRSKSYLGDSSSAFHPSKFASARTDHPYACNSPVNQLGTHLIRFDEPLKSHQPYSDASFQARFQMPAPYAQLHFSSLIGGGQNKEKELMQAPYY